MRTRIHFLILSLLLSLFSVFNSETQAAQPTLRFEQLSIAQGLSQNTVTSILRDSHGFMWFGTRDGLNRYDGYEFKVFRRDPQSPGAISDNSIWSIFEDNSGQLWVGTSSGGLNRYDHQTESFTHFRHDSNNASSLSDDGIRTIYQDSNNTLWIGTNAGGLNRFHPDSQSFSHLRHQKDNPHSLSHNQVYSMVEDQRGNLWIGTGKGLSKYHQTSQQFERFVHDKNRPDSSLSHNRIRSVFKDSQGTLWIGTNGGGLNQFDPANQRFKHFKHHKSNPNSLANNFVISIQPADNGKLWLGTWGGGLNLYDPITKRFSALRQSDANPVSVSSDLIYSLLSDSEGMLWIGTSGGGINRFDPKTARFGHFRHNEFDPNSLSENNIRSILKDSQGDLWLGTRGSGLNHYDHKSEQFFTFSHDKNNPDSLSDGQVYALLEDSQGKLWVGTAEGLNQYDPDNNRFIHFNQNTTNSNSTKSPTDSNSISDDRIKTLVEGSNNTLWIGTAAGLNRLDRNTGRFKVFKHNPADPRSLSNNNVMSTYIDSNKVLWVGTLGGGLNQYNPDDNSFVSYRHQADDPHSLSHDRVFAIHRDAKGTLWVGTAAGLNQFDAANNRFIHYREADGLANDVILGILEDEQGFLWLSGNKGLSKFNPVDQTFTTFDAKDGLQSNEFNLGAVFRAKGNASGGNDGEMLFGGINGFNRFYPNTIKTDTSVPSVTLTDFLLSNQHVPIDSLAISSLAISSLAINRSSFSLSKAINELDEIALTHKQHLVSLQFSAMDFSNPMRNHYAYKLDGWDEDWIYTNAKQRRASYTKLDPGNYVFRVKASNHGDFWLDATKSIKIKVMPPWWKTWQAYLLYTLSILGSMYALYRYRTKALIQKATELEQRVLERTATINQLMSQKQRMFANVSHEFKTPLTLILNPLDTLSANEDQSSFARKVAMMKRNGQRLLRMVDQLLELSKLETTQVEQRHHYSLAQTLSRLLTSFQPLFDSKNLTVNYQPFTDVVLHLTADSLEMILNNLLSNAIKYTPANGEISLTVEPGTSDVIIKVIDNGIGISPDNQQLVFNRFTRASENHGENIPGAGIGLALVKDLVQANQGNIQLSSQIDQGSTFTVTLPLSESQDVPVEESSGLSTASLIEIDSSVDTQATAQATNHTNSQTSSDTSDQTEQSKPTLLLIDDNPDMLELLSDTLAHSYHCLTAANGEQGLLIAKEQLPDLVISDVMMPGISGFEVLKQLKQNELTSHIPVVLLTAKGDIQSRIKGWAEQADEYLEKPFNSKELQIRIDNLLSIRALLRHRYQQAFTAEPEQAPEQSNPLNAVNQAFIDKINAVLEKHYSDETLDVTFFASELAISQRQLARKMRSLLDLTPAESIRSFRLKKAVTLLNDGHLPGAVAYQVGFTSHSYFSRCFKAQYDCLPSSYHRTTANDNLT